MKNNFSRSMLTTAAVAAALLCAATARADWSVDNAQSNLYFVTTKAGQAGVGGVQEVQAFRTIAGTVDKQGQVKFTVDLASVDTAVPIRDDRLRELLFNVGVTPSATFSGKFDPAMLDGLDKAGVRDIDLPGQFTLAGQSKPLQAKLRVTRLVGGRLLVSTRTPMVINASDYGIGSGVERLRALMGLNFLATSAPVSFNLVLNEQR